MENYKIISDEFTENYKNKQPNWGFNGLGYIVYKRCVDVSTPVLCDDLTWKPAGDLEVGQRIIGFDDIPIKNKRGSARYLRFGKVMYNKIEDAECMGIEMEDGEIIYCTPDHKWLIKNDSFASIEWRETKDLTNLKNDTYLLRPFGKPWKQNKSYEAGFISAAYDGEGCLDRIDGIQFIQVDNPMLDQTKQFLNKLGIEYKQGEKGNFSSIEYKNKRQQCYNLRTYGTKNLFRFLGEIRPPRLLRKFKNNLQDKSDKTFGKAMRCNPEDYVKVKRVFNAGKRKIAVLSTDIETHFTGGFASHNTYARPVEKENRTEEWHETVQRCINGAQRVGASYTKEEAERLFDHIFNLRCNFAGRMLWQLGTSTVDRFGLPSLCNCWFVTMDKVESFCFLFEHLMLGGGVGFSVKREHIHELPKIKRNVNIVHDLDSSNNATKDADFIVPDSREGWVSLLRKVLDSYFHTGESFSYSTILVRGSGEPIGGFGGKASGPKHLIEMVEKISSILNKRQGKKVRSIDVLDVANIIGSCVVSGNVRRSALICIGDPDDMLYIKAKRWDLGNIPNWRAMSNNSIYADSYDHIMENVWDGYAGNGEPYGFINIDLARKFGRIGEKAKDGRVEGFNPCAEATLEHAEPCDLSELYLNNIDSPEQLNDCAKLLYKTQKAILRLPSISQETEEVVRRNMRIGLGVTGICQSLEKLDWLDDCYNQLKDYDKKWSKEMGWPTSIKLTVVKPSGTLSILAGSSPGVHPAYSEFFIRRVRIASNDPLIKTCRDLGFPVEYVLNFDGTINHDTMVVEFPCRFEKGTVTAKEMSAVKQLELVKKMQKIWADQAVSCTVYYKKEELEDIKEWLRDNYQNNIKSVSFLLHSDHGFAQAPYEEIDESTYKRLKAKTKSINKISSRNIKSGNSLDGLECEGGACPIK